VNRAQAADLAQEALIWLADRPEELGRFLALTGTDPAGLRARADDPALLGAVLDHLLGTDALVLAFAAEGAVDPALVARARAALPGGDAPHWT
jgi:hypothetical protein